MIPSSFLLIPNSSSGISEQQRTRGGWHFSDGFVTIPYCARSCFFSGNCVFPHAEEEPSQDFPMKQLQGLIILWALPDYALKKRAYLSILYYFRCYQYGASWVLKGEHFCTLSTDILFQNMRFSLYSEWSKQQLFSNILVFWHLCFLKGLFAILAWTLASGPLNCMHSCYITAILRCIRKLSFNLFHSEFV